MILHSNHRETEKQHHNLQLHRLLRRKESNKRKHCSLHTQDEIACLLSTANILHILNAPSGHEQLRLGEESRRLMTIRRQHFKWLPLLKCCLSWQYAPKDS